MKRRNIMQLNQTRRKRMRTVTHMKLTEKELDVIKCQRMLTDRHISAANQLLASQFPDVRGLQSTVLGQSLSFEATEPPFIQILHVGGNHWMTVYAIDNHLVKVYDSLYPRQGL